MEKGFTLLELIVVIVILGILATLGFSQYVKMVEKGRTAEAKAVLGQIRSANAGYFQEHATWATSLADLAVNAPTSCIGQTTHYFSYTVLGTGVGQATRCLSPHGKLPGGPIAYVLQLDPAAGTWGGTAGYY